MNQDKELSVVMDENTMEEDSKVNAPLENKSEPSTENEGDISQGGKRRRTPNSKYDTSVDIAEEEQHKHKSATKVSRKNSEELLSRTLSKPSQETGEEQVSKNIIKTEIIPSSRHPLNMRSRVSMALSSEKISRIIMRALQVFGPLSANQCAQLINKRRKPNVEVILRFSIIILLFIFLQ